MAERDDTMIIPAGPPTLDLPVVRTYPPLQMWGPPVTPAPSVRVISAPSVSLALIQATLAVLSPVLAGSLTYGLLATFLG